MRLTSIPGAVQRLLSPLRTGGIPLIKLGARRSGKVPLPSGVRDTAPEALLLQVIITTISISFH